MPTRSWSDLLAGAARTAAALLASPRRGERTTPGPAGAPSPTPAPPPARKDRATPRPAPRPTSPRPTAPPQGARDAYPGDYTGAIDPVYAPALDGDADPGEIVWTWVPYEEDHSQGKDRPVLVVGHDGPWLLALMLTSKDHSRDVAAEARRGRRWLDIGSGPWDSRGRDSEVRLDRVLRIDPERVRREGAIMDRATFDLVTAQIG
ncbi:type II toxin-antitoxin system PemK/MazF family toxin [Flavimobilis soli]|nr:type II toxin-antitoxin system PemK/MazF family toxin [Flavimobilis soli]